MALAQAQCANCGGYRMSVVGHRASNGKLVSDEFTPFWFIVTFLSVGLLLPFWLLNKYFVSRLPARYRCALCGFMWDQDAPPMPRRVRPDLIRTGAARLDEEQAAAMEWLRQQDHQRNR